VGEQRETCSKYVDFLDRGGRIERWTLWTIDCIQFSKGVLQSFGLELGLNRVVACEAACVMNLYVFWNKFLS